MNILAKYIKTFFLRTIEYLPQALIYCLRCSIISIEIYGYSRKSDKSLTKKFDEN